MYGFTLVRPSRLSGTSTLRATIECDVRVFTRTAADAARWYPSFSLRSFVGTVD